MAVLLACSGPQLSTPTDGTRFVDGQLERRETVPFRYYGTTVVDALPPVPAAPQQRSAMFQRAPARSHVEVAEPVTPWVFPLDLPLELLVRLFRGPGDLTVPVPTSVSTKTVVVGAVPGEVEALRSRALAARVSR